jgi:hypothetical protein
MPMIVIAHIGCENLHLTEAPLISPVLVNGEVDGMLGSAADFCDECNGQATVIDLVAREVGEDYPHLDLYVLRHAGVS